MLRRVTAVAIVVIMGLFCISVFLRFTVRKILVERMGYDNALTQSIFFDQEAMTDLNLQSYNKDWGVLYPFSPDSQYVVGGGKSEEDIIQSGVHTLPKWEKVEKLKEKISGIQESINAYSTDLLMGYQYWVAAANEYDRKINWNIARAAQYNNVATLSDGCMISYTLDRDVTPSAQSLLHFNHWLKNHGIEFIYLQAPPKVYDGDAEYGVIDFANQNIDKLKNEVADSLNFIDLRTALNADKQPYHSHFFITDHHWKPATALLCAEYTAEYINATTDLQIDLNRVKRKNFISKDYKDCFIGSHGVKIGKHAVTPENMTFFFPEYDVNASIEVFGDYHIITQGDFTITYSSLPDFDSDEIQDVAYGIYGRGDCPYIHYVNVDGHSGLKVLIVGDSYKDAFWPFISQGFDETTIVDLRYFNGSLETLVERNDFDLVLCLVSAVQIGQGLSQNHNTVFDFR